MQLRSKLGNVYYLSVLNTAWLLPWAKEKYAPETSERSDAGLTARISYSGEQVSVSKVQVSRTKLRAHNGHIYCV